MDNIFISDIIIRKVRHLENIQISLSKQQKKHLILTGRNGSGKTSVLEAISVYLNSVTISDELANSMESFEENSKKMAYFATSKTDDKKMGRFSVEVENKEWKEESQKRLIRYWSKLMQLQGGVVLDFNSRLKDIRPVFKTGKWIVAYYRADREFEVQIPKHVEKVTLKDEYLISEKPRADFIKYLLDLKMTQALAATNGKIEKAESIKAWFVKFDELLKIIFEDNSVQLEFDEDTFEFHIQMDGRETFDFNTLSSGYAAVLDIVVDLIMRMENRTNRKFDFSIPGIVLIDEIETHLHLDMQKHILKLLTTVFPNIQFIVSTHSPFILNSLDNVVIYDLENKLLVENGLGNIPYSGIVEGYFKADAMSEKLRFKYERYKELTNKSVLTDDDFEEIADLELYLDEIPDYLALNLTTEYQRLKAYLRNRSDI